MDQQKIGDFLAKMRKERGMTQSQLGSLLFVARETVSKWERGINIPDYESIVCLSKLYNITINEILAGEMINEKNEEQVAAIALDILTESKKTIKNNNKLFLVIILVMLFLFLLYYFFYNYNSLKVYIVSGDNDEYHLNQSLIVLSKQKSYIQIGNIYRSEDNTLLSDYKITLYYEKGDTHKELFETNDDKMFYVNLNSYNNFTKYRTAKDIVEHLYLDVIKDDKVSTIALEANLDYANKDIAPMLLNTEINEKSVANNIPDIIKNKFKLKDGTYVYTLKVGKENYNCKFDEQINEINCTDKKKAFLIKNKISEDYLYIYNNDKDFICSIKDLTCDKDTDKYLNLVNSFKNKILN